MAIEYIGVASFSTTTSSTSVPVDISGISGSMLAGDLLVVATTHGSTTAATWSVPSGWSEAQDSNNRMVAWSPWDGSTTSFTFTTTVAAIGNQAVITVFRGAAFGIMGTLSAAAGSATVTASSITLNVSDSAVIAIFNTLSGTASYTTPTSYTEVYDAGLGLSVNYQLNVASGATGNVTSTASSGTNSRGVLLALYPASSAYLIGFRTAVQNTSSTTITVNVPSGTANNDLMILVVTTGVSTSSAPWTTPSGWTLWGNNGGRTVFYRIASSEPASYTVTQSQNTTSSACILTYRDAVINVFGTYSSNSNPSVAPSITTTANDAVVFDYVASRTDNSVTYTTPTNFTPFISDSDATNPSYAVFSRVQATAGATGTASTTPSGGVNGMSVQFSIIPKAVNSNFFFMMGA